MNKETRVRTISTEGITLSYDSKRFEQDPATYVAAQLKVHQDYHELVRRKLSEAYQSLNDGLGEIGDLERRLQFVPENIARFTIELSKLIMAPCAWIRLKTLRGYMKEGIQQRQAWAEGYRVIERSINGGKDFIGEIRTQLNGQLPETVRNDLEQWGKAQEDLLYTYSRLHATAEKRVKAAQRVYKLFFPDSEI